MHKDELLVDVDDEMFKLYGHVAHTVLERAGDRLNLIEKRLFGVVAGTKISAQIDSLSLVDGILTDWKFTTVYGFMENSMPKPEWVYQLNIQLELLRLNGLDAKELQIVGLLRDWRPLEAETKPGYPRKVGVHKIPMFERVKVEAYIKKRIKAHRDAAEDLPQCKSTEHWGFKRCKNYCPVSAYCDQYKRRQDEISASRTQI
jgi:hypothetical protein